MGTKPRVIFSVAQTEVAKGSILTLNGEIVDGIWMLKLVNMYMYIT